MRRVTSLLVALQLGLAGSCKSEEASSPQAALPSSAGARGGAGPVETPTAASKPATDPSYPAALDDLLALVPKDATSYMIVRDPAALIHGATWFLDAERDAMNALLDATKAAGASSPDDIAEFELFLHKYGPLGAQLVGDLQLDRGALIVESDGATVFVFGASAPTGLHDAAAAVGLPLAPEWLTCRALAEPTGLVVCATEATALAAFAPGKDIATRKAQLGKALPGLELERANVLGIGANQAGEDGKIAWALETMPGVVQFDVQTTGVPPETKKFFAKANPTALEAVAPGTTFVWGNTDMSGLSAEIATVPAPFNNVLKSMTGEYLYASTADPFAMVLLVGATDPQPFRGAVALAMMGLGEGKKELPDGTSVDVKLENVSTDAGSVQAVHASLGARPELAQYAELGIKGEAFAFSAGKWIALALGSDSAIVAKIAKLGGTGPSPELLASLPAGLARTLTAGEAVFAAHLTFDALQSTKLRTMTKAAIASIPKSEEPVAVTMMEHALEVFAPLSTISGWMTWNDLGPQFHVALQSFSDPSTEAGKAARGALVDVAKGADPTTVYGGLAETFADGPRALSYRIRAGQVPGAEAASLGAVALVGMLAAIAIPAFTKYMERSRAAK